MAIFSSLYGRCQDDFSTLACTFFAPFFLSVLVYLHQGILLDVNVGRRCAHLCVCAFLLQQRRNRLLLLCMLRSCSSFLPHALPRLPSHSRAVQTLYRRARFPSSSGARLLPSAPLRRHAPLPFALATRCRRVRTSLLRDVACWLPTTCAPWRLQRFPALLPPTPAAAKQPADVLRLATP